MPTSPNCNNDRFSKEDAGGAGSPNAPRASNRPGTDTAKQNYTAITYGNDHGAISFGHIHKQGDVTAAVMLQTPDGEHQFSLDKDGKRKGYLIHRLVYQTFNGKIDTNMIIDHINRNKYDNRLENLRWSTRQDNWYNFELSIEKCIETLERAGYTIIPPQ